MVKALSLEPDLRPPRLPEFGNLEVSWAMSANPMWDNFGVLACPDVGALEIVSPQPTVLVGDPL